MVKNGGMQEFFWSNFELRFRVRYIAPFFTTVLIYAIYGNMTKQIHEKVKYVMFINS